MLMYHPKSNEPVDVHPSQIDNMKAQGWGEKQPTKPTTKQEESKNGESHRS